MSPETKQQHWLRRGQQLRVQRKAELCRLYRSLGGLGGMHPPEKWTKDEVLSSIIDIEWHRLPDDHKLPDPPFLQPPCDQCGLGPYATPHKYGGDHNYHYTQSDKPWVPASEEEAERIARDFPTPAAEEPVEVQPSGAIATTVTQVRPDPAPYRVHLIYTHGTQTIPESFRTTLEATDKNEALRGASDVLKGHAKLNGWTNLRILSYASCERVPDREKA